MAFNSIRARYFCMRGFWTFILLSLFLSVSGCSKDEPQTEPQLISAQNGGTDVSYVTVAARSLSSPISGLGTIGAFQQSSIGPLVQGPIDQIFVLVGDRVAKGEPLFQTRRVDYEHRLNEALAALRLAQAEAELAERKNERIKELKSKGYASKELADEVTTTLAVAQARVYQAEATVATARQALEDTTVRAPYDCVVTARNVGEGVFLSTFGSGGLPPVLEIMEVGRLAAVVNLPQDRLSQLMRDSTAILFIEGIPQPLESFVAVINDRVDSRARTVEVRLPILNPDYTVKPGLSVRAEIQTPERQPLVIPRSAVAGDSAAPFVFVLDSEVVRTIPVAIRELDFDHAEVVAGLSAGQQVVLNPPTTLRDGSRVRPSRWPASESGGG